MILLLMWQQVGSLGKRSCTIFIRQSKLKCAQAFNIYSSQDLISGKQLLTLLLKALAHVSCTMAKYINPGLHSSQHLLLIIHQKCTMMWDTDCGSDNYSACAKIYLNLQCIKWQFHWQSRTDQIWPNLK